MTAVDGANGPERLEAAIAAAAARCLPRRAFGEGGASVDLLGLDSLRAIELAAELEDQLGVSLPEDLLDGCPDTPSLAARLHHICVHGRDLEHDPYDRMLADAVLPADVRPSRTTPPRSASLADARTILLTGATGFLGGALAQEILGGTAARLVCLVRPGPSGPGDAPCARLRDHLMSAGVSGPTFDRRVRVVPGDLSRPGFGLDPPTFDALASEADAICHAGASVNWASTYAGIRDANVGGTLELLRLACRAGLPFHFVSSLSVCYSTGAPPDVNETFDPLPYLRGVHLGYAQTKIAGEALVREAGRHGLPVRIYRPALISGHSDSGAFNRDDILSTLIRGCVHMGAAPDLDWTLDALPVDAVARAILSLSSAAGPVFHLAHERPRRWRECVLWMRLYGYALRLVPYGDWLRQLDAATNLSRTAAAHPLRALRGFFLNRPAAAGGLTLPELYEDGRRTKAHHRLTLAALARCRWSAPPLDAALLDRYFEAFIGAGELPEPARRSARAFHRESKVPPAPSMDAAFFSRVTGLDVKAVHSLGNGSEHSIVSELAGWRSRRPTGLFRFRIEVNAVNAAGRPATHDVVVKAKARDADVLDVGDALASMCDARIGASYERWRDRLGMTQSHERELAIYGQTDQRFVAHAPRVFGTLSDPAAETWLVVLERIADGPLLDSARRPDAWTRAATAVAVDGLAALHAIWYGREAQLFATPWIGYVPSAARMAEMTDLWEGLASHAAPSFTSWSDAGIVDTHRSLIRTIGRWWPALERMPRTLIHNDFNPRNICLRGTGRATRLCAYDWELATLGAPQRDLAELLCFVMPASVTEAEVRTWIERHRRVLARETCRRIDAADWVTGFRAALYDVLVNRLATYALIDRVRPQRFLPRVVRTWRQLYRYFPLEADR